MSSAVDPGQIVTESLGYLLKHAHRQLDSETTTALEPFGIDPRALGVLRVLASHEPMSQQEVAHLLGVDRTTMVALLDSLEALGIISRQPQLGDRRRNLVQLTEPGLKFFRRADSAAKKTETEFLSGLGPDDAQHLRNTLRSLVVAPAR
jgi:DNA-binding MarR family transcriptional regulator